MRQFAGVVVVSCAAVLAVASVAGAQLADWSQVTPMVPGGAVAKSLDEQVGAGQGDDRTWGSSIYLIKRDPARSIRCGRQLFQRKFTAAQGIGPRVDAESSRKKKGTGLGLAIVKHILNRHRGLLTIKSRPGEGTRVEVQLSR